jgi:NAD(P)-dependent dehydrogenase (short-subunit alcohol dehydrogenase family)
MSKYFSVLVTGANRGIGLEFVKQLVTGANAPQHLFATCRKPEAAEALQSLANSHPNLHVLQLDVKDYKSYDGFVEKVTQVTAEKGLDLLINNAGIALWNGFDNVTPEMMVENFEVNTVTPLMLTKALLPLLRRDGTRTGKATVINITSKMGSIADNTSGGHYSYRASKTALNMVTKGMSVDLAKEGIHCVAIHPGWVQTDMGGPKALITTETSVSSMIDTINRVGEDVNGLMLNYDGKPIPW